MRKAMILSACAPAPSSGRGSHDDQQHQQYGIQPDEPAGPGGQGTPSFGGPGPRHAAPFPQGQGQFTPSAWVSAAPAR